MYGFPPNIDLAFFVGEQLLQLCARAHELILNFDGGISVTEMSSIEYTAADGARHAYTDFPRAVSAIAPLLNRVIVTARGELRGTMVLEFEGGGRLEIPDDRDQYESFVIKHRNGLIVV